MGWLARWFAPGDAPRRAEPDAPPARPATTRAASGRPSVVSAPPPCAEPEAPAFVSWLLGCAEPTDAPLSAAEARALAALDAVLSAPVLGDDLLPRAAALLPQLMAMLRQADLPVPALAQRIARDPVLAAEVLRLASSPYYRAQGRVADLAQAIARVGERGVSACIARVVLRPIFDARSGGLPPPAAVRLWAHAELLAAAAADAAADRGLPPFDGYLAGLLHGTGWTIAWRVLARAAAEPPLPPSAAFAGAVAARAHALFGRAVGRWAITPGLTAFAADAVHAPLDGTAHPLGAALRAALPTVRAAFGEPTAG